ncbi:hypothetical protein ASG92_12570 [Arthrobacter sp. Soil736]|nr:hypothetical protein ASG92_12570 [Arthrobacter sp. Soil736]
MDLLLPGSGRYLLLNSFLNRGRGLLFWRGLLRRCRLPRSASAGRGRRNVKERQLLHYRPAADFQKQSGHMLAVEAHGAGAIAPLKTQTADAVLERDFGPVWGAPVALDLAFQFQVLGIPLDA